MKKIFSILTIICLSVFAVSCNNEAEELEQQKGYLKLDFETLVSTNTRAVTPLPSGYNARTLHVTITDSQGNVVYESQDAANDNYFKSNILLNPGTYTITALVGMVQIQALMRLIIQVLLRLLLRRIH